MAQVNDNTGQHFFTIKKTPLLMFRHTFVLCLGLLQHLSRKYYITYKSYEFGKIFKFMHSFLQKSHNSQVFKSREYNFIGLIIIIINSFNLDTLQLN